MKLRPEGVRRPAGSPRFARWVLNRLVTAENREFALGDLEEDFQDLVDSEVGRRGARRWYWRQVLRCALAPRAPRTLERRRRHEGKGDGMDVFLQDIRYGFRMLAKRPSFTAVAILTLAVGIGGNVAVFSVVQSVILRSLPYREPDRIVTLWENNLKDGIPRDDVSPANFLDWAERQQVFSEIATNNPWSLDYGDQGEPETFVNARVSHGFFETLGVNALHGRTFRAEEYELGKTNVVLMTYGLWQRKFGGDPSLVGRALTLDNEPTLVVGILPPEFDLRLHQPAPVTFAPQPPEASWQFQRRATYLKVIARLKPGVTLAQAREAMDNITRDLAREHPQTNGGIGATVVPLEEHLVGKVRPALFVLLGAVGLVLLIACTNVANLLLARGSERGREIAVRAALGAGGRRLMRQLLTESLLLSLLSAAAGVLLARWAIRVIVALSPGDIPRMDGVGLSVPVLLFAVGIALLTAIAFGVAPALQGARTDPQDGLRGGARATSSVGRHFLRSALVVSEVALALVLLVGAGLLLRSFVNLLGVDPGFARDRVVALQTFVWDRYTTPAQRMEYARRVLEELAGVPGVQDAGVTTALPLFESGQDSSFPITVEGEPAPPPDQEPTAFYTIASPDYFRVMGTPLLRGRWFSDFDRTDAPPVVIVNEAMAKRVGLGDVPVGKRIQVRFRGRESEPRSFEVVGLVGSMRHEGLDAAPRPEFFIPYAQSGSGSIIFVVRTASDASLLVPSLKAAVWKVNPGQPFYSIATMDRLIDESVAARRFNLLLLSAFAALAMLLSAVGIYGVMSFIARQRTQEIGVRMALGAKRGDIVRLILRHGMGLAALGAVMGLLGSFVLSRFIESQLFGVEPTDPLTYGAIATALLSVGLAACAVPAWRATRVDPLVALRYE